jgi:hypothetical protein
VTETGRPTRSAADPLNLRPQASRLEIRRHFFSQRVIEDWNKVPASLKQAKNVKCFKRGYRTLREKNGGAHPEDERRGEEKSCVAHNYHQTVSERLYRSHGDSSAMYHVCMYEVFAVVGCTGLRERRGTYQTEVFAVVGCTGLRERLGVPLTF